MSALSRNDRCRRNGRRRCTTRILDDAVLERKLGDNRKTREDVRELRTNREEKKESKTMKSSRFERDASLPLCFYFFFSLLSCFVSLAEPIACRIT